MRTMITRLGASRPSSLVFCHRPSGARLRHIGLAAAPVSLLLLLQPGTSAAAPDGPCRGTYGTRLTGAVTRMVCAVRLALVALFLALLPVLTPAHAEAAAGQEGTRTYNGGPIVPGSSSAHVTVGDSGGIQKVTVSMVEIVADNVADTSLVLTGPHGQSVMLMAPSYPSIPPVGAGFGRFTFDDDGAVFPCETPPQDFEPGTYRPFNCAPTERFDNVPPPPYAQRLSAFNGTNAAGTWNLSVGTLGDGDLSPVGWSITITFAGGQTTQALSITSPHAGDSVDDILTVTSNGTTAPTDLTATFPDAFDFTEATGGKATCGGTVTVDRVARTVRYQFNDLNTPFTCAALVTLIHASQAGTYAVPVTGTIGNLSYSASQTFEVAAEGG